MRSIFLKLRSPDITQVATTTLIVILAVAYILLGLVAFQLEARIDRLERKSRLQETIPIEVVRPDPVSRANVNRGRAYEAVVTAYTLHPSECGKSPSHPDYGRTASGVCISDKDAYKVVAVDNNRIRFGTRMTIHAPEGDYHVTAVDTGGEIEDNSIDLFVADRKKAAEWGRRKLKVTIME